MRSITLLRPNQKTFSISKSTVTFIAITALAFAAGVVTIVKPIFLLAIPAAVLLYAAVRFVAICNEVRTLSFDAEGVDLSYQEILDELDM